MLFNYDFILINFFIKMYVICNFVLVGNKEKTAVHNVLSIKLLFE